MHLLASNQIEKNAGWGAECFLDEGFRTSGATVVNVDYKINQFSLCRAFAAVADTKYDGFFLQRGDFFPHDVLSALPTPRIFWATELVSRRRDQDVNLQSGLFDFVYVRSIPCRAEVIARGWRSPDQVEVLSSGFSSRVFRPLPDVQKDIDVLFVGSPMPRRDAILDDLARHFSVARMRAYGNAMNHLFNRARIVLNLHSEEFPDTETRVYEALGSGAFLITEPLSEENPFVVGEEFVAAGVGTDMIDTIRYYLDHANERETIAAAGHATALGQSYTARAATILARFAVLRESGGANVHSEAGMVGVDGAYGAVRAVAAAPDGWRPTIDIAALRRVAWKESFRAAAWGIGRFAFRAGRKMRHLAGLVRAGQVRSRSDTRGAK